MVTIRTSHSNVGEEVGIVCSSLWKYSGKHCGMIKEEYLQQ